MTKAEKKALIREMANNLARHMLAHADKMPDNWDGIELRWYLRDCAAQFLPPKQSPSRVRSYRNDLMTRPL